MPIFVSFQGKAEPVINTQLSTVDEETGIPNLDDGYSMKDEDEGEDEDEHANIGGFQLEEDDAENPTYKQVGFITQGSGDSRYVKGAVR